MHIYQYSLRKSNANCLKFGKFWMERLFMAVEMEPATHKSRFKRKNSKLELLVSLVRRLYLSYTQSHLIYLINGSDSS
jgi:hypothetical protein